MNDERYAEELRSISKRLHNAVSAEARIEADLKRTIAQVMLAAEASGVKAHNAQTRAADLDDDVYRLRLDLGVARGSVQALRLEAKRVEIAFETYRTRMATERAERRAYGA